MTTVQSIDIELDLGEPRECEGCGAETSELFEDDGMNWLCKECFNLDNVAPPTEHQENEQ